MDKEKIMKLCQQIGLIAMSNKKHYPALHSDFDFINDAQMDIFREITAPPKSNGDRIRQMTDEELAEWFAQYIPCNECERSESYGCDKDECTKYALLYMKQEVSEDDSGGTRD